VVPGQVPKLFDIHGRDAGKRRVEIDDSRLTPSFTV
jgi:hypothetical protein